MLVVFDKILQFYKTNLNYCIDYLYPPNCIACFDNTLSIHQLCAACFNKLSFITKPFCKICGYAFEYNIGDDLICASCITGTPFTKARHLLKFDEHSKDIIHAFKYYDQLVFAKYFAKLFYNRYAKEFEDADIITCVPMNRFKRLLRKYNTAQLLAQKFATLTNKLCIPDLLIKTKWTISQTKLTKKQRAHNLKHSLVFNQKYDIKNKKNTYSR